MVINITLNDKQLRAIQNGAKTIELDSLQVVNVYTKRRIEIAEEEIRFRAYERDCAEVVEFPEEIEMEAHSLFDTLEETETYKELLADATTMVVEELADRLIVPAF